ncbi:unnamed protein product [Mytilus coruscus]|uniref:Uncharacterized protein n=1 Tax=Mytilus coruscus TaxID=42192 RepID=A0A6J8C7Q1_MYTCO|nr:unnamed protein product [Mytilus coruscus]
MATTEKQKIYEKSAAYVRSIIHHQEVNNMQQTLKCVRIDDNAEDLAQLLMSSPRIGFTDNLSDKSKIKSDVHELMTRIANVIGEMDGRFQCTIFPTGSSAGACTSSKCGKQQINSNNSTGKKLESQETKENGVLKSDIVSLLMTDESNETPSDYNVHSTD